MGWKRGLLITISWKDYMFPLNVWFNKNYNLSCLKIYRSMFVGSILKIFIVE